MSYQNDRSRSSRFLFNSIMQINKNSRQADLDVTKGLFTVWTVFTRFTRKNFVWFNINTAGIWKINFINCYSLPSALILLLRWMMRDGSTLIFALAKQPTDLFVYFLSILVLCTNKIYRFRIYLIFLVAVVIHSDFYIKSDPGS